MADFLDLQQITIDPILSKECIKGFTCGEPSIDSWLNNNAFKHHEKDRIRLFCARLSGNQRAIGIFCLTFLAEDNKKIATRIYDKKSVVPLIFINYIAVYKTSQKNGLGRLMLMNAISRAYFISHHVPIYGVALRSLNEGTSDFYVKHGFRFAAEESKNPLMILPIWTIRDLIRK